VGWGGGFVGGGVIVVAGAVAGWGWGGRRGEVGLADLAQVEEEGGDVRVLWEEKTGSLERVLKEVDMLMLGFR